MGNHLTYVGTHEYLTSSSEVLPAFLVSLLLFCSDIFVSATPSVYEYKMF
jgi:hypothetical protein